MTVNCLSFHLRTVFVINFGHYLSFLIFSLSGNHVLSKETSPSVVVNRTYERNVGSDRVPLFVTVVLLVSFKLLLSFLHPLSLIKRRSNIEMKKFFTLNRQQN